MSRPNEPAEPADNEDPTPNDDVANDDVEEQGNDAPMKAAIWTVGITAVVLSAAAGLGFGLRSAAGVAVGGAIATLNLLVFARIGQAFVSRKGNTAPWAVIAVVKLVALLGGVWLILKNGYISGLSLTIGYGSLPIGITLGSLFGPKPPETMEGPQGRARQKPQTPRSSRGQNPRNRPPVDEG